MSENETAQKHSNSTPSWSQRRPGGKKCAKSFPKGVPGRRHFPLFFRLGVSLEFQGAPGCQNDPKKSPNGHQNDLQKSKMFGQIEPQMIQNRIGKATNSSTKKYRKMMEIKKHNGAPAVNNFTKKAQRNFQGCGFMLCGLLPSLRIGFRCRNQHPKAYA